MEHQLIKLDESLFPPKIRLQTMMCLNDSMVPCNNLYLLHVCGFLSAYTLSDTESTLKSQAEGEGVPLGVTQQKKQDAEDSPVERPQHKLSMCNVKLLSFPS